MSYHKFKKGQWVKLFPEEEQCWTEEFSKKIGTPLKIISSKKDKDGYIYRVETPEGFEIDVDLFDEELQPLSALEIAKCKVKNIIE